MTFKPDIVVCNPNVSSERGKAVFIHFEVVDPVTFEITGKTHNIAIPHADALRLFGILGEMAKRYGWSDLDAPDVLRVPPDRSDLN